MQLIWNGTPQERLELLAAVQRNCTCITDVKGARVSVCEAHTMLVQHQRVLNGLLFAGRIAQRFICEEWLLGDPAGIAWRRTGDTATVRVESGPVVRNHARAENREHDSATSMD
jgi:hypothetical protein